jgi:hypothetical protein
MKFTIRDLMWLTVVVAMGVAWWLDRWQLEANRAWQERQNETHRQDLVQIRKSVERMAGRSGMPNPFTPTPLRPKP